jgi:hypothetical protein
LNYILGYLNYNFMQAYWHKPQARLILESIKMWE